MTQMPVRVRVRCDACRAMVQLSQEQYRELVGSSRLALVCPHCGHQFEYSPLASLRAASAPPPRPRTEAGRDITPVPPAPPPPPPAPHAAPEFPPPPFAPLGAWPTAGAAPPPFAPLGGAAAPAPAAPAPQGAAPSGGAAPKLTLNDRWKRLPLWVQWTVIGVMIVVLAVVIFAMPTSGGPAPATTASTARQPAAPPGDRAPEAEKGRGAAPEERRP